MDTEETFFLALKTHRESNGIVLDDISEFTKINPKYLHAIEEGNFNIIPNIYMRLFIRSYVKYIGADYNQALADYELYTTGKIQPKFSETNENVSVNKSFILISLNKISLLIKFLIKIIIIVNLYILLHIYYIHYIIICNY